MHGGGGGEFLMVVEIPSCPCAAFCDVAWLQTLWMCSEVLCAQIE